MRTENLKKSILLPDRVPQGTTPDRVLESVKLDTVPELPDISVEEAYRLGRSRGLIEGSILARKKISDLVVVGKPLGYGRAVKDGQESLTELKMFLESR
jgi:hypothetical protein